MILRRWKILIAIFCVFGGMESRAQVRPFVIDTQTVMLEKAEPKVGALFRAFRPNLATGRWDVDVTVTNGSTRILQGPFVLRFDIAQQIAPGVVGATIDGEGMPFLNLSSMVAGGQFQPGQALQTFTLSLGDGQTRPTLAVGIYSLPQTPLTNLVALQTLTADGAPLDGVTAQEIGPDHPRTFSAGRGGWFSLEMIPGVRGWRFSADGRTPVVAVAPSATELVTQLPSPRLSSSVAAAPAIFSGATIPAPIPPGWSPIGSASFPAGDSNLNLDEALDNGATAFLVRWDDLALGWRTIQAIPGTGAKSVSFNAVAAGVYAVLRADLSPVTPPSPAIGDLIAGVALSSPPSNLTATGAANPSSRTASSDPQLIQTLATVEFVSADGPISSGLSVPCEVSEEYQLRDGSRRVLPSYRMILVGYQRPEGATTGSVVARFPLRPFQLLGGEQLSEAIVRVQVLKPGSFDGSVFQTSGGGIANGTTSIAAASGDFNRTEAVILREISISPTNGIAPPGVDLVRAFEINVSAVQPGQKLSANLGPQTPGKSFVLARAVFDEGRHGFQPVQRFVSGADGALSSTEPTDGLAGIDGGGQYVLFQTAAPEALVAGVARNSGGAAKGGLAVRRGPWTAFTDANGNFKLLAAAGANDVSVSDPTTGDAGTTSVQVAATLAAVQTSLDTAAHGPHVVAISPADGATNVARVTSVVINFDKALNPVTIVGSGVQLLDATNGPVSASTTLNLAGDTVTILPTAALASGAQYTIRIAPMVSDVLGRTVEGNLQFGFTTIPDAFARGLAAQITIFEPGATNLTPEILAKIPGYDPARDRDGIVVQASQGTAEPGGRVILVNESSDETATVLAEADGSFVSTIHGSVQDYISAVVVNANGTRNQIPATRQQFDDGSVGLFGSGGTITSKGPGPPVDLIIDPGAIHGKTVFKIDNIATTAFQDLLNGKLPDGVAGPILGSFTLTESGDPLEAAGDISVPVKLADLGLPPGSDPTNFAFVVTRAVTRDGVPLHQIVDMATYEPIDANGGRVRTQSPPFVGMLERKLAAMANLAGLSSVTPVVIASNSDNPHKGQTGAYGILPMQATLGLKVGGFVRSVSKDTNGVETLTPLPGALVRVIHPVDEVDPGDQTVVFDGDLVSISDEHGNFGFFYKPSQADILRSLVATHAAFPFQKALSGPFAADPTGATAVRAELRFNELPAVAAASDGSARPEVTVGHDPALPTAGTNTTDGATVFVTAVDDKLVNEPTLTIASVQDLNGNTLPSSTANKTLVSSSTADDLPARKARQFRVTMTQPGRVILNATASDGQTTPRTNQHAISFGVSRSAIPPGDPDDVAALRVVFSWPPSGGTNVPALMPITLRFNRSIPASVLQPDQLDWLTFGTGHIVRRVTPSADRREITVFYDGPTSGGVKLTVGPGITGDSGKSFDQDSIKQGAQSYEVQFTQSPGASKNLDGNSGVGAVSLGRFVYALDRNADSGVLHIFDFKEPSKPEEVQTVHLRYPTAMSLIPQYSMPINGNCATQNYLAVFSGTVNDPKFMQLGTLTSGKVTFGPNLVLSGGGTDGSGRRSVAFNSTVTESHSEIVRSRWDPPYLAYFELGADLTSVKLINLASFQRVVDKNGILDSFKVTGGDDGLDQNGDGDFCDPGDRPPTPDGDPLIPPGLAFSVAPHDPLERIIDFDFNSGLGVIFAISSFAANDQPARFHTMLSAGETNNLDNAFITFTNSQPKRMIFLPAVSLEGPTNRIVRDIAVVSLAQTTPDGALEIIDVSTPSAPKFLNQFTLPKGEGTPASIERRDDGLLALTTSQSTLLLDPQKLNLTSQDKAHPSIVGRIPTPGTGVRDFVADPTGINVTYGGASRKFVETAPRFSFVRFNAVVNPNDIAAQPASITAGFLKSATPVQVAEIMQPPNGGPAATPDPSRHYYVLADIPGGAADDNGKLPMALSAVDVNGMPEPEIGGTPAPAIVGDDQLNSALLARRVINLFFVVANVEKVATDAAAAQGLIGKIRAAFGVAKIAKKLVAKLSDLGKQIQLMPDQFVARRLSDNPDDPLYNKFLAGPFVLLGGAPSIDDLTRLHDQANSLGFDRAYLRPAPRLWAGLPSERMGGLLSSISPFNPPPSKLLPFVSQLSLNPNVQIAGVTIPRSGDIINEMARLNASPSNPITSFFSFAEQITLLVSVLNNVPVLSSVVKGDWQPMLIPGAHGLLRVNYNERPMILVPGFAGSQLEINQNNEWLGLFHALGDSNRFVLRIKPDGSPTNTTYATDAVRFTLETPVSLGSIYGDWIQHLTDELGLTEYNFRKDDLGFALSGPDVTNRLSLKGAPNLSQTPVPNLFVFPYDWRLDNQKAAEALREYVRLALEIHPDADGIDLVAHSNGGLVSRAYMLLKDQRALVKRFVTVGTPWLGAPKALSGMRTGDINEATINVLVPIPAVRAMLQFSPGAHQLLPSKEYFDLGYRPLIEDGFDINTNGLPNEVFDFNGYMEVMAKQFFRKPLIELGLTNGLPGDHPVRANANGFRLTQPIGDHSQDATDVEVHHIMGMSAVPNTIGQIRVRGRLVPETNKTDVVVSFARVAMRDTEEVRDGPDAMITPKSGKLAVNETNQFRMNEEIELRYVSGDGTVPIGSLVRGFGSDHDLNAKNAKLHPLVGGLEDDFTGHNPMLNSDEFFKIFDDIYVERPTTNITLSVSAGNFSEGSVGTVTVTGTLPSGASGEIDYVVDYGDGAVDRKSGNNGQAVPAQHRYRQSGVYNVTVGAAGAGQVYGVTSKTVTVQNQPPTVTIAGVEPTVNIGESRIAVAEVRDPGLDDRHTFVWSTPDGSAAKLDQFAIPITFNTAGPQVISVTVTDTDGATGTASFNVNVLPTPSTAVGANFGVDPAAQNSSPPAPLARAPIDGFDGGHPEIIVRFNGHAPSPLNTVGISVRQEGIVSAVVTAAAGAALGGVFDLFGLADPVSDLRSFPDRIILPRVARHLGQIAEETEYARLVRELPDELLSIDLAATNGLVAADGRGRPFEADVLYLEGGTPKILQRWKVPNVDTNEGVRLHFDWINQTGVVERVTANTTISPLNGSALETIPPIYYGVGEAKAADRIGPVTLGILNPATDLVHLLARDNITPGTNVTLYAVFDANENGRFDDDVFYPLDTNVVEYARLPQRPFAIVGVDEEGNVGKLDPFTIVETRNFLVDKKDGDPKTEYEHKLDDIRAAIRNGIKAGFQNGQVQKYLLDPTDLWVFEQGSGANLWKPNFRDSCNGIYLPGKSDNDYELFLPVELAHPYTFDAAGRAQFISDGPFETSTLQGDWYFKRPIGFDAAGNATQDDNSIVEWEYQVPSGFLSLGQSSFRVTRTTDDGDLSAGFHSPFTPAEIIARSFTLTITTDPTLRAQLPDTTFFPERREHFMFGRLHLERPPAFGDDPVGDAGMGRQMLLLKWLIEGAYVTPDDNGGPNSLSLTAPSLLDIYLNWQQSGVPVAEGFEWGVFQDFAALKSKPFQNFTVHYSAGGATDDPRMTAQFNDDAVREQQASRIKKLGKAAIRATLARIAGDTNFNSLLTTIPSATIANNPSRSFEGFILDLARSQASSAFGDFATDRPDDTQPPDLGDFLRAKNADKNYLKTIVTTPGAYERYVTTVFEFLRNVVQTPTRANYKAYLDDLRQHGEASELFRRQENFNIVVFGQGVGHPGLIELDADRTVSVVEPPLAAEFYSADTNAVQAQVSITRPGGTNGPAPLFFKKKQTVVAASPPSPGGPTTITGFADDDDTVVDASPVIETSDAETVTEATIVDGVPFETQEDNTIEVDAVPLDLSIPAPAVSDDPVMVALIQPDHGQDVFVLDDWPATQTQGRSPRYYLRKSDKLIVEVLAKPGLPPFNLAVTSESDPLGRTVSLQSSHGLGVYDNSDPAAVIQFTNLNDTQNADRIYVKDEELVTIEVNGNGFQQKIDVMVDLGELSLATLTHADRTVEQKPRFDYVIRFFGATSDDFAFFNDGFTQFPDDVAASVNGGDNPMRQFIQHFADNTPAFADVGEADILYVHAHGNTAGQLFDHITNNAPAGTRKLVLDPVFHLTPDGLWRTDAEWAILDACSTLNPVVTPELLNAGFQPGKERWETVLTNSNGSPGRRLPHGILGFHKTKPSLAAPHRLFMNLLEQGSALVDAWEKAMDDFQMPWAISCYKSALADNIREISQDPAPGDRLVYLESTGVLTDLGCEDCGGFFEDDEAFESISTLPVEAPEDWARGEQVLRANGYDPNDLWRLGVSEETETSFAANSVPQRKRVARAYHWEKALRDNSLEGSHVVVRISEGGAVRIIDSARNRTTGGRR